jgi:ATP/maltotriose-dependent transcriptional regulator MalT
MFTYEGRRMSNRQVEIVGQRQTLDSLLGLAGRVVAEREAAAVLLAGEAGTGKTLVSETALGASGLRLLRARASEGVMAPYGLLAAALEPGLARAGFPLSLLRNRSHNAELAEPAALQEALIQLLAREAGEAPLCLLLEDLQWADEATLSLLGLLPERLAGCPVLACGTYRSEELPRGHRLRWLRNELRRGGRLTELEVHPLDAGQSGTLVDRLLGEPASPGLKRTLYHKTGGIPLLLEELCAALGAGQQLCPGAQGLELAGSGALPLPESVRDSVLLRIDGLDGEARRLLETAAVLGVAFELDLCAELGRSEAGLDALLELGLIVEVEGRRGRFRHALVRDAVRDEISWSRRRELNRRAAAALAQRGAEPERVAAHLLDGGEPQRAREALVEAARRGCQLGAFRDAARAATRALDLWPAGEDTERRLDLLQRLAHCTQLGGLHSEALRALQEILDSAPRGPRSARALRDLATVHGLAGARDRSLAQRALAAEAFEELGEPGEAAEEWLAAAESHVALLQIGGAREAACRAAELARGAGRRDVLARALALEGYVLAMQGQPQAAEQVQAGLALALEHGPTQVAAEVYRRLAGVMEYGSDYAAAGDAYARALEYCGESGAEQQARLCLGCMAWVLFQKGDWKRSLELCRQALVDPRSPAATACTARVVTGLIQVWRGQVRGGRGNLQESLQQARFEGLVVLELLAGWGLALADEGEGRPEAAGERYEAILERWQGLEDRHDMVGPFTSAASHFGPQGQRQRLGTLVEALRLMASCTGNPEALAGLAFTLGEAALAEGRPEAARGHFDGALTHLEPLELPLLTARAGLRSGTAHRAAGDAAGATARLERAYRLAHKLGARPLASAVAAELDLLEQPPAHHRHPEVPDRGRTGPLTHQQLKVMRHISEGLTNKQIAARLFISKRTVDMHVRHVLERLDCRTRTEAVRRATELGLLQLGS